MRSRIAVFKNSEFSNASIKHDEDEMSEDESGGEELDIPFEELLDDMARVDVG